MANIDFELISPTAIQADDAVLMRRGAAAPNTGALATPSTLLAGANGVVGPSSATDNALARFDSTTGKLIQNSVNPVSDAGEITLPAVASPATPAAGRVNLLGTTLAGSDRLGFVGPDGRVRVIQNELGDFTAHFYLPGVGSGGGVLNMPITHTGSGAAGVVAVTNLHAMLARVLCTAGPAANAVVGSRCPAAFVRVGADANGPGGFLTRILWGPATGVSNATHRAFAGHIAATGAPTDVEPSSLASIVGMGWDAADTNIQIMHNDGSGTATKIDLGASFPVPTVDATEVYELQLYSPNDVTQSVSYRVIKYNTASKTIAAEASGTITTDLPAVTTLLAVRTNMSVGGTNTVVGIDTMGILVATAY